MTPHSVVRNSWYVAGLSKDFPKESLSGHVIAKRPIVMWRTKDGDIAAFDDRCSHKRFPLSKGRLMPDGTLECAYHGLRYDTSGKCVMIPSHPTGPISPQAKVIGFPVKEQDGLVWNSAGRSGARRDAPAAAAARGRRRPMGQHRGGADAGPGQLLLLIENLLDITHFYPLHDGNIGDVANSRIPDRARGG